MDVTRINHATTTNTTCCLSVYVHFLSSCCCSFPPCLYLHVHVLNGHGCSSQNNGEITAAQKSVQGHIVKIVLYIKLPKQINCLKQNMHNCTYVTNGAEIHELTNLVLHKVLVKHSEVNHLQGQIINLHTAIKYLSHLLRKPGKDQKSKGK